MTRAQRTRTGRPESEAHDVWERGADVGVAEQGKDTSPTSAGSANRRTTGPSLTAHREGHPTCSGTTAELRRGTRNRALVVSGKAHATLRTAS